THEAERVLYELLARQSRRRTSARGCARDAADRWRGDRRVRGGARHELGVAGPAELHRQPAHRGRPTRSVAPSGDDSRSAHRQRAEKQSGLSSHAVATPDASMSSLSVEYDNMLRCIRCAACLTSCPTYVVTHKEEEGPRGRIAIMRAIVEGHLD